MGRLTILMLCAIASTAKAETPMTGDEFGAYVRGRTLTFQLSDEQIFGVEQYLSDQRVIWSRLDGTCTDGRWFERGTNICFLYENDLEPKCWEVFRTANGIRAEFSNRPGTSVLFEARESPVPLVCGDLLF